MKQKITIVTTTIVLLGLISPVAMATLSYGSPSECYRGESESARAYTGPTGLIQTAPTAERPALRLQYRAHVQSSLDCRLEMMEDKLVSLRAWAVKNDFNFASYQATVGVDLIATTAGVSRSINSLQSQIASLDLNDVSALKTARAQVLSLFYGEYRYLLGVANTARLSKKYHALQVQVDKIVDIAKSAGISDDIIAQAKKQSGIDAAFLNASNAAIAAMDKFGQLLSSAGSNQAKATLYKEGRAILDEARDGLSAAINVAKAFKNLIISAREDQSNEGSGGSATTTPTSTDPISPAGGGSGVVPTGDGCSAGTSLECKAARGSCYDTHPECKSVSVIPSGWVLKSVTVRCNSGDAYDKCYVPPKNAGGGGSGGGEGGTAY